jgi:hypothetical protein
MACSPAWQTSREIPDTVEVGTNYVVGSAPVSQNG